MRGSHGGGRIPAADSTVWGPVEATSAQPTRPSLTVVPPTTPRRITAPVTIPGDPGPSRERLHFLDGFVRLSANRRRSAGTVRVVTAAPAPPPTAAGAPSAGSAHELSADATESAAGPEALSPNARQAMAVRVLSAINDPATAALPRHRHDLSRTEVRRRQQARILAALVHEVLDHGYDRVTVAGLGRRAGVSSKTFYEMYADKETAFLDLYILLDAGISLLAEVLDSCTSVSEALEVGFELQFGIFADQGAITRVITLDALGATERIVARRVESFDYFVDVIARTAARLGQHPSRELVVAAVGAINELVFRAFLGGEAHRMRELKPVARDIFLRLLAPGTTG